MDIVIGVMTLYHCLACISVNARIFIWRSLIFKDWPCRQILQNEVVEFQIGKMGCTILHRKLDELHY